VYPFEGALGRLSSTPAARQLLASSGCGAFFAFVLGPTRTPDSLSYLTGSAIRPPLVPAMLGLLRLLLGAGQQRAFVFIQATLGFFACLILANEIKRFFRAGRAAFWVILAPLVVPQFQYASHVMSESLAYGFCCLALASLLVMLRSADPLRPFALLVGAVVLLVLTRTQFTYVVPLLLLATVPVIAKKRDARSIAAVAGTLLGAAILLYGTQAAYSVAKTGHVHRVSATGIQLLTVVMFNTVPGDLSAISDPQDRAYATSILDEVQEKKLGNADRRGGAVRQTQFANAYNAICWEIIARQFDSRFGESRPSIRSEDMPRDWPKLDRITTRIAIQLLGRSWSRVARHVVECLYQIHKYFAFVVIGVLALGVSLLRKRDTRLIGLVLAIVSTLWTVNALVVALVEFPMTRYTFYFDSPVLALVLAAVAAGSCVSSRVEAVESPAPEPA
jgi:hypothetical protein